MAYSRRAGSGTLCTAHVHHPLSNAQITHGYGRDRRVDIKICRQRAVVSAERFEDSLSSDRLPGSQYRMRKMFASQCLTKLSTLVLCILLCTTAGVHAQRSEILTGAERDVTDGFGEMRIVPELSGGRHKRPVLSIQNDMDTLSDSLVMDKNRRKAEIARIYLHAIGKRVPTGRDGDLVRHY